MKTSNTKQQTADLDRQISQMVRQATPPASSNPWMVRKTLNRPPPPRRPLFGIVELTTMVALLIGLGIMICHEVERFCSWQGEGTFDFTMIIGCIFSLMGMAVYAIATLLRRC